MNNLVRYNLFLFSLCSILLYIAISKVQLFGVHTQLFNILTILVLLTMGIYYPRFSRGISELLVRKVKLVWMTVFLILLLGFKFATPFIGDGIFYMIVFFTCVFLVINLKQLVKEKQTS